MYSIRNNSILITRRDCSQLFFVFTGIGQETMGPASPHFLKNSGLDDRNLVILRDPKVTGFLRGCSDEVPDFPSIVEWLRTYAASLSHVNEVYCVGISSGGPGAMVVGNLLGAKKTWIFAPRVHPIQLLGTDDVKAQGTPIHLSPRDKAITFARTAVTRLRRVLRLPGRQPMPAQPIIDAAFADFEPILKRFDETGGSCEHHVYYVPTNQVDDLIWRELVARGSRNKLVRHLVLPPPEYPKDLLQKSGWDHYVIAFLEARGELKGIFPARA